VFGRPALAQTWRLLRAGRCLLLATESAGRFSMDPRDAPIQRKLTAAIMLASTVVLCLTAAVFIVHEVISFRQTLAQYSRTIARITAAQSSGAVDYENEADCRKILSKLNGEPSILLAALYGRRDRMLARY